MKETYNTYPQPMSQPKHFEAAGQIAEELLRQFSPNEIVEVLGCIKSRVKDHWEMKIQEHLKALDVTKEMAAPLNNL
jgi:hypothetical protein